MPYALRHKPLVPCVLSLVPMKTLGNILWLIFGGILIAIEYFAASLVLMITIIGIPFGVQTLKLGILALWPFGQRGSCRCQIIWLSVCADEYYLDIYRRNMDLTLPPGIRLTLVYYYYRHSIWHAAL